MYIPPLAPLDFTVQDQRYSPEAEAMLRHFHAEAQRSPFIVMERRGDPPLSRYMWNKGVEREIARRESSPFLADSRDLKAHFAMLFHGYPLSGDDQKYCIRRPEPIDPPPYILQVVEALSERAYGCPPEVYLPRSRQFHIPTFLPYDGPSRWENAGGYPDLRVPWRLSQMLPCDILLMWDRRAPRETATLFTTGEHQSLAPELFSDDPTVVIKTRPRPISTNEVPCGYPA